MEQSGFIPNSAPKKKEYDGIPKTIRKRLEAKDDGKTTGEIVIDWNSVMYLASIQCTQKEIAGNCGISISTLAIRVVTDGLAGTWKEFYERYTSMGHASLRRQQWLKMESGDTKMLIHLGEHYLGQVKTTHVLQEDIGDGIGSDYDLEHLSNSELDNLEDMLKKCEKQKKVT